MSSFSSYRSTSKHAGSPPMATSTTSSFYLPFIPGLLSFAIFLIGPALAYTELVLPMTGLVIFGLSALFGVFAISWALWLVKKRKKSAIFINMILGLVPSLTIIAGVWMGRNYPLLNDVSTDLDNPPRFLHNAQSEALSNIDTSHWVEEVRENYPGLISLQLPSPAPIVFEQVKRIVDQRDDMHSVRIDHDAFVLEGVATTGIFKFQDDFIIRLQQLDNSTQVDMRSKSRIGKGDFGANAKRIKEFFTELGSRFGMVEEVAF